MPPFSTPFRVPSARPSSSARAGAGPQFASTPRFLLSQQTPAKHLHDDDSIDIGGSPQYTPLGTDRPQGHREAIEDSDEELPRQVTSHAVRPGREELSSSPTENGPELDAEFEALFGSISDRVKKKRRLFTDIETPSTQRRRPGVDLIESSPPDSSAHFTPHIPPRGFQTPARARADEVSRRPFSAGTAETPLGSTPPTTRPSFRNQPRFVLSASQAPPPSQSLSSIKPFATPAPSSPPSRRKPGFVLPRSPSPSGEDNDTSTIPTPFSPSSRALRRRGRPRATAPEYLPGGIAAEVRSWILEMAAKREALQVNTGPRVSSSMDLKTYFLVSRMEHVRQSALKSSGPLAFARGRVVDSTGLVAEDSPGRNFLLVGPPRFRHVESPSKDSSRTRFPELQAGCLVGICRGLVWEIDLECQNVGKNSDEIERLMAPRASAEEIKATEKWLVAMEWELLP
ncbi:hypothetical protein BDV59DRAFT_200165 [Aspergillus ambiguus]|uniref:uncharacterized protein n=1 Tax=Aspergillus ambiguus TaxID=176160 RepID=UPI003CCD8CEF